MNPNYPNQLPSEGLILCDQCTKWKPEDEDHKGFYAEGGAMFWICKDCRKENRY